jgi:hypothetical protein
MNLWIGIQKSDHLAMRYSGTGGLTTVVEFVSSACNCCHVFGVLAVVEFQHIGKYAGLAGVCNYFRCWRDIANNKHLLRRATLNNSHQPMLSVDKNTISVELHTIPGEVPVMVDHILSQLIDCPVAWLSIFFVSSQIMHRHIGGNCLHACEYRIHAFSLLFPVWFFLVPGPVVKQDRAYPFAVVAVSRLSHSLLSGANALSWTASSGLCGARHLSTVNRAYHDGHGPVWLFAPAASWEHSTQAGAGYLGRQVRSGGEAIQILQPVIWLTGKPRSDYAQQLSVPLAVRFYEPGMVGRTCPAGGRSEGCAAGMG